MKQTETMNHRRTSRAFTLVELLLVVGIIMILAVLSFPYLGQLMQYKTVVFTGEEVKTKIYYARTYSMNRNSKCFIDVLNDADSLIFYYGTDIGSRQPIPESNTPLPLTFSGEYFGLNINPSNSGTQTLEFSKHGKPADNYQIAFDDILIRIDGTTSRVYVE